MQCVLLYIAISSRCTVTLWLTLWVPEPATGDRSGARGDHIRSLEHTSTAERLLATLLATEFAKNLIHGHQMWIIKMEQSYSIAAGAICGSTSKAAASCYETVYVGCYQVRRTVRQCIGSMDRNCIGGLRELWKHIVPSLHNCSPRASTSAQKIPIKSSTAWSRVWRAVSAVL